MMDHMDDLSAVEIGELPHEFETDLVRTVLLNHDFALTELNRTEEEETAQWEQELAQEDYEVASAGISRVAGAFEEYRQAANQLALVGVVPRLQHWTGLFVHKLQGTPKKNSESRLVNHLEFLNDRLGRGPVPTSFFEDVVNVRDSIIHADSQTKWTHRGKPREVADRYRDSFGRVDFSGEQLKELVSKAVQQIVWYDEKLA